MAVCIGQNVTVLQLPSDVCIRPCDTVVDFYGLSVQFLAHATEVLKCLKFPPLTVPL